MEQIKYTREQMDAMDSDYIVRNGEEIVDKSSNKLESKIKKEISEFITD